jgi:hypothetical protein
MKPRDRSVNFSMSTLRSPYAILNSIDDAVSLTPFRAIQMIVLSQPGPWVAAIPLLFERSARRHRQF